MSCMCTTPVLTDGRLPAFHTAPASRASLCSKGQLGRDRQEMCARFVGNRNFFHDGPISPSALLRPSAPARRRCRRPSVVGSASTRRVFESNPSVRERVSGKLDLKAPEEVVRLNAFRMCFGGNGSLIISAPGKAKNACPLAPNQRRPSAASKPTGQR